MPLVSFSSGQVISSANVNANFGLCVLTDTSRTITVTHTYSASQALNGGITGGSGADITINTNKFTVVASSGNTAIGGTLAVSGAVSSGTVTTSGLVSTGNVNAAAGGAIYWSGRSILDSPADGMVRLTDVAGTSFGRLQFGGTTASYPSLKRSSAALAARLADDSGDAALTVGGLTASGTVALTTAVSKIVPGATSLVHRNNADTQNNFSILDNGDSTFDRGNLTLTLGGLIVTSAGSTLSIGGSQVVATRRTGYTNAWTGAAANLATGYDASTITLPQLAARVRAIQESLTTHGLIGA